MKEFDYIIAGAGCAGLSLVMEMIRSGQFGDQRILLVDRDTKKKNDRTWCFWETSPGPFQSLVHHEWKQLWFHDHGFSRLLNIAPYTYKMIRGIDFYRHCLEIISRQPNIVFITGEITAITGDSRPSITVNGLQYNARFIFSSMLLEEPALHARDKWILQHFKGWRIAAGADVFDEAVGTLMDFRVDQKEATAFVYVLPFSSREALVEFTVFSAETLPMADYEHALERYLREQLSLNAWQLLEEEYGVIPMTSYRFPESDGRVIYIGTAGGRTKGSSGYTFQFIQEHSRRIVQALVAGQDPIGLRDPGRFDFYDRVLLDILAENALPGHEVFTRLFRRNPPARVLRFLDNASSLLEELKLISTLPTLPFSRAALRQKR